MSSNPYCEFSGELANPTLEQVLSMPSIPHDLILDASDHEWSVEASLEHAVLSTVTATLGHFD